MQIKEENKRGKEKRPIYTDGCNALNSKKKTLVSFISVCIAVMCVCVCIAIRFIQEIFFLL